jgi:hypothetical protein
VVDDNEDEPQPSEAKEAARRPRRSRPFWRRGWFWVGVIVAEIAIVLVLSVVFERSATEVDLAGADTTAFCEQARTARAEAQQRAEQNATEAPDVGDPTAIQQERESYLALAAIAPEALVADFERLAELDQDLVDAIVAIGERKAADPTYTGFEDLTEELERVRSKGTVAAARVELVLREQCQIDPTIETTTTLEPTESTTTVPLGPVAPATSAP